MCRSDESDDDGTKLLKPEPVAAPNQSSSVAKIPSPEEKVIGNTAKIASSPPASGDDEVTKQQLETVPKASLDPAPNVADPANGVAKMPSPEKAAAKIPSPSTAATGFDLLDYVFSDDEVETAVAASVAFQADSSLPMNNKLCPPHLKESKQEFGLVLYLIWPEMAYLDEEDQDPTAMALGPYGLLDYLEQMSIWGLDELHLFAAESTLLLMEEDEDAEIYWDTCVELSCWDVDLDPTTLSEEDKAKTAEIRRDSFLAICEFIGLTSAEEFDEFCCNMMACDCTPTEIVMAIMKRLAAEETKRKDSKSSGEEAKDESQEPPNKKARLSNSPTSVMAQDLEDDNGGGKVGAVRDLQKAKWVEKADK